jgi:hypothetical protein
VSGLRKLSRSAHPEAWAQKQRYNRLRRLTQRLLRAKDRGDEATMARLSQILKLVQPDLFDDMSETPEGAKGGMIAVEESDHEVIQKKPVDTDDS